MTDTFGCVVVSMGSEELRCFNKNKVEGVRKNVFEAVLGGIGWRALWC
mgnify:CR=1 FL=1